MEQQKRWLMPWAIFFFLGMIFWTASVSPQTNKPPHQLPPTAYTQVQVPNLIGSQQNQAPSILNQKNLQLGGTANQIDSRPPGTIVNQTPKPGQMVSWGTKVHIWVAVPLPQVQVPNLIGLTRSQAISLLQNNSLQLGNVAKSGDGGPPGTFVRQTPTPGQMVPKGTRVHVWEALPPPPPPPQVQVPNLIGLTRSQAISLLQNNSLQLGNVAKSGDGGPPGTFVRQTPTPGQMVLKGTRVHVWEASEKVPMPSVVNLQETQARQVIGGANLQIMQVSQIKHDRPKGIVVQQWPAAGTLVNPGASVKLTVSLGPLPKPHEQVQVPNLLGKKLQEARTLLGNRGLVLVQRGREDSTNYPRETITRQDPQAGDKVDPSTRVNVWIASGGPLGGGGGRGSLLEGLPRWVTGGLLGLTLGYGIYRLLRRKRPGVEPKPMNLEAKATLGEGGRFEAVWEGGKPTSLELRLRAKPDMGTQDIDASGPLVKGERREHE